MYFRVSRNTREDFRNHNVRHSHSALTPGYFILERSAAHFPAGRGEHRNVRICHRHSSLRGLHPHPGTHHVWEPCWGVRAVGQGCTSPSTSREFPGACPPGSRQASDTCWLQQHFQSIIHFFNFSAIPVPICKTMIATAPASHSARAWILLKTPRIPIQLKHSHVKLHMDLCLSFWGFYTFYPNKSGHNKCSEPPQGTCYILECPQMSWCLLWTFPEGLVTPQTLGSCWRSRMVSRMSSLSSQKLELPSHRSSSVHSKPFLSTQKPWVRVSTCQQVTNLQDLRVVMSFNYII